MKPLDLSALRRTYARAGLLEADASDDPFVQFVYLNPSNVEDGLLAWIQVGVDPSANYTASAKPAAYLAADGGHALSNGMFRGMVGGVSAGLKRMLGSSPSR